MRPWSWRWWFLNRETGSFTVAQFPNLPLWIAAVAWLIGRIADGAVAATGQVVTYLALSWWAGDEILRGVNPWRRLLGVGGMAYVAARVLA